MGRKNYNSRDSRRRHVVTYTPSEISADYEVLMTNGSSVKKIVITGTRVSAWTYAIRLGMNQDDGTMPGTWWPIDARIVKSNDSMFSVI
jgi:hypothetical protein